MRFKIDENLPPDVAIVLRSLGHDAMTIAEQGMVGKIDPVVAEVCKDEKRAIVTGDLDFANIREFPPEDFCGLIVLRTTQPSRQRIMAMFQQVLDSLATVPLDGALWIVEESRIRIRGPRSTDDAIDQE